MTASIRRYDNHLVGWVRCKMANLGVSLWDWDDQEVLEFYYRALNDRLSGFEC